MIFDHLDQSPNQLREQNLLFFPRDFLHCSVSRLEEALLRPNSAQDIEPPVDDWEGVQRIEYEPGTSGARSGEGTMFLNRRMALGECMKYIRTWSSYSAWQDKFQAKKRSDGGIGDVVDEMFDKMRSVELDWQRDEEWIEKEVEIEWGSGLLLARRR